jgi:magnesium transporter
MGGLSSEEDVFAPVSKAVKTRWAWLAVNLCTAFIASRVIDGLNTPFHSWWRWPR